jgi:hypothetical protein
MKKIILSITLLFSLGAAWAQAPQALNYQGVARNSLGVPMANQALGLRLTVHDGSPTGTVVYQETQTPTTNAFGLYNVAIGTGTVVSGTVAAINWGTGTKYMQVEIDPVGGSAYVDAGTNQLLSVPYAIFADKAENARNLTGTVTMGGDVTGTNAASTVVKLNGNAVSATAPASGQVLTWNSGSSTWGPATLPASGTVTSITAGAGLSGGTITTSGTISMPNVGTAGTYGSATVVPAFTTDAQGRVISVTNSPITGDNWGTQTVQTDATLTGSGTTASKLSIAQQGATVGQALEWNGSSWQPASIPAPVTYSAGTGMSLAGTIFNAQTTNALWNANELQGKNISATAPVSGQVLEWTGTAWTPSSVGGVGTVTSVTAGAGLSGGTITSSGTLSLPNVGTVGTYGSATQVPVFTTDAQGRITGVTLTTITAGASYSAGAGLSLVGTTFSMPNVGTAGTYGSATQVPVFTTDAQGRITGVTNTTVTGTTPGGAAGGDLTGTYPNPTVAAGAITDAKVSATAAIAYSKLSLTGHIAVADHSATGVPSATTFLRGDNTWSTPTAAPSGPAGGDLTGTYPNPTLNTSGVTAGSYGTATQVPSIIVDAKGRITSASNTTITGVPPGGAAGGDLTGTYPNPTVAAGAITDAKVSATAAIAYSKLSLTGHIAVADHSATGVPSATTFLRGDNTWATPTGITPGGPAGGDLTGTYPNPTLVTTGVIAGTYGTATQVPTIVVDTKGRITSASNTTITTGVAGTINYMSKFTSATAIGNSQMFDNGTSVGLGTITPTATNKLHVLNTSLASSQHAVHGIAGAAASSSFTTATALYGESSTGNGVAGASTSGSGVLGFSAAAANAGVYGTNTATNGFGVYGVVTGAAGSIAGNFDGGTAGGYGVIVNEGFSGFGTTTPSAMLHVNGSKDVTFTLGGVAFSHQALIAQTSTTSTANVSFGAVGYASNSTLENHGLHGWANGSGAAAYNVGVWATGSPSVISSGNSYGVYGNASNGATNYGVYGTNTGTGYAGYFAGTLYATTGTFGVKPFKIDDPRDPANKYLYHSSIESNEMMNIYKGHVTTDANGEATVTLPSYFTILNKDYDYQLTCVGQFAQAIVSEEVTNNQFKIKTDKPNVKVSWQVSGVRQDPVANAYRIVDEVEKPAGEKGFYLQPEVYGQAPEKGLGYLPSAHGITKDPTQSDVTAAPAKSAPSVPNSAKMTSTENVSNSTGK